jgi:hypothetical protein
MHDIYCFICGHYLSDAHMLTSKNKKIDIGEQDPKNGGTFTKSHPSGEEETSIYVYKKDTTDILYHNECAEVLSKKCKYRIAYKDLGENLESPNSHGLVPYNHIERPPNVDHIKKDHQWSEEQIIEEWSPVIDEIRTKNKEDKEEKKKILQEKREAKREQLRKQKDKRQERIDGMKRKVEKMTTMCEKDKTIIEEKTTIMEAIHSDKRKERIAKQILRLEEKIEKKEEEIEKQAVKIEEAEKDLDLFVKAWF